MNELFRDDLRLLLKETQGPCVSFYLPTQRDKDGAHQNAIRMKNLLRMAEVRLLDWGYKGADTRKLLDPVWQLVQERPFWQRQKDGLAVFVSPHVFYHLRSPAPVDESVTVAENFYLRPLLPLLFDQREYYVLALCLKGARLFHGTPYQAAELDVPGMPGQLAAALNYDIQGRQLFRNRHGSGAEEREAAEEVLQYFRLIDTQLQSTIGGQRVPLVLAGVAYLVPLYKEVTSYPVVMEEAIYGSPAELWLPELHERAWSTVQPHFEHARRAAMEHYAALAGTGRTAARVEEVLTAAAHGRVETLLVDHNRRAWGRFDSEAGAVTVHDIAESGDEDLIELAILQTYAAGGKVLPGQPGEVPDSGVGAILRY